MRLISIVGITPSSSFYNSKPKPQEKPHKELEDDESFEAIFKAELDRLKETQDD